MVCFNSTFCTVSLIVGKMTAIQDSTKSGLGLGVGGQDLSCLDEGAFLFLARDAILKYYRKVKNIMKKVSSKSWIMR